MTTVHRAVPSFVSISHFTLCTFMYFAILSSFLSFPSPLAASEGERRRRRGTTSESDQLHLVSSGPLLLGQNNTEVEENPCVRQNTSKSCTAQNCSHNVNDPLECNIKVQLKRLEYQEKVWYFWSFKHNLKAFYQSNLGFNNSSAVPQPVSLHTTPH